MENKPESGNYKFTSPYSVDSCVKYVGIGIAGGTCKKFKTTTFNIGDVIYSDRAYYDSETEIWSVGITLESQNIGIPTSKVQPTDNNVTTSNTNLVKDNLPLIGLLVIIAILMGFIVSRRKTKTS